MSIQIEKPRRTGLRGARVFVVEDRPENRVVMEAILEKVGAEIGFEETGKAVPKALKAFGPVDLILLDLSFPDGITGFDILAQIRTEEAYAQIPVIAVSARDANEIIQPLRHAGFAGLMSKPIVFERFARQLLRIFQAESFIYVPSSGR